MRKKTNDVRTYQIKILGRVEEEDIQPTSPLRFRIEQVEETQTRVMLRADQSGIIGLIRHLHDLGLVIISVSCRVENLPDHPLATCKDHP